MCSLDELDLKLNENEMSSLRSLINSVIESVETSTDFASLDEVCLFVCLFVFQAKFETFCH